MAKLEELGAAVILLAIIVAAVYFAFRHASGTKYNKALFGTRRIDERTTDIPLEGNLEAAAFVLYHNTPLATPSFNVSLPAAFLMRWYNEGRLVISDSRFVFTGMPEPRDKDEKAFYRLFREAAGDDLVIDEKRDVHSTFYFKHKKVPRDYDSAGRKWFLRHGYIEKEGLYTPTLSEAGAAEARKVISLRNYLQDLADRKVTVTQDDGHLKDYLVYAFMFDMKQSVESALCDVLNSETLKASEFAWTLAETACDAVDEIEYDDEGED